MASLHDRMCDAVDVILHGAGSPRSNAEHADELLDVVRPDLEALEGDCVRLSEELDEVRATNAASVKDVWDGAHWEGVADRMRDEIARLTSVVGYWEHRAEESQKDASYFEEWATANGHRLNGILGERDRFRSAWLSARRRAADEANFGLEALDRERERYAVLRRAFGRLRQGHVDTLEALVHSTAEASRWRTGHETAEAQLVKERRDVATLRAAVESRQTTDAPRLEQKGTEEDGGTVWRLLGSTSDGVDVYVAPVGAPAPTVR